MKNKKSIAMAMAAVSTMGAVAPAFADEIIGTVVDNFNLDNLTSTDDKVRVQAEKDLEVTKAAIEKLVNEVDSNGNKIYNVTQREEIKGEIGQRYSYVYVTLTSKDDVNNTVEHKFTFYKKVKLVGDTDQDFGKELPWDTENKIIFDFIGKNNKVFVYNPETKEVNKEKDTDAYAELSRVIYQLKKSSSKITAIREVIQTGDTYADGYTIYAGKIGQDATGETKVARIDILGNVDEKLVKLVDANNDFVGHWAEDTIVDSMIAGIVDNSATFRPEDSITRAEFAKIACNAFGLAPVKAEGKFSDVDVYQWYAQYVEALAKAGYVKGDGDGTFRPMDKITRQEAAVIIANMHANKHNISEGLVTVEHVSTDVNGNKVHTDIKTSFADDASIAVWADESVEYLYTNGLSNGYETENGNAPVYMPANQIKRAEALVMMTR